MKKIVVLFATAIIGAFIGVAGIKSHDKKLENNSNTNQRAIQPANGQLTTQIAVPQNLDFTYAAEKTVNSVVHVKTEFSVPGNHYYFDPFDFFFGNGGYYQEQKPAMASGSGVIVSADGYIVTNNHVIEKAEKIKITLNNKQEYDAVLIGSDPSTDLALLKIEADGLDYAPYGNSDDVKIGEWVLAVGNPFNLTSTVTAGIVSAKGRDINILNEGSSSAIESFIQTDAAVNPGNSGGALVNTNGELIGINTAIKSNTGSFTGYSFAIPVNIVRKVIDDLLEFGIVQRAYIGVSIRDIDAQFAAKEELKELEGVYVSEIMEGGAAKEAGIEKGDIITRIGTKSIKNVPELQEQLGRFRPGDNIIITVNRDGSEVTKTVTLKNREGSTDMKKREFNELAMELGAEFELPTNEELKTLNIPGGVKISRINSGKLRSAGIKEDFIITKVDKKAVNSYEDMARILENKKGGVLIEGIYPNGMKAYYGFGIN